MSKLKRGLWKGFCVAVAVPALMVLAMPVRALMLENGGQNAAVPPDAAMVKGSVTSLGSLPLPDVTVKGIDAVGNVLAMAKTGPDGQFSMQVPASAGKVVVVPEGGTGTTTTVKAGGYSEVKATVPPQQVLGSEQAGWWSGLGTTSKAALLAAPIAGSAAIGFAVADNGSTTTRLASPIIP